MLGLSFLQPRIIYHKLLSYEEFFRSSFPGVDDASHCGWRELRRKTFFSRLWRLLRRRDFWRHPARGVHRRIFWWFHWRFQTNRLFIFRLETGMEIGLAPSSASKGIFLNDGFSDRSVADLFIECLGSGMTAFDCGAHIGEYTLLFSKLVGRKGTVHAFEPDPRMFSFLEENVSRNQLSNVHINAVALSDNEGTALFIPQEDATTSSLREFSEAQSSFDICVPTTTLDKYATVEGLSRIDALKIDVEGAEASVIVGAHGVLRKLRPALIFVECDHHNNAPLIAKVLKEFGYDVLIRVDTSHVHPHIIAKLIEI